MSKEVKYSVGTRIRVCSKDIFTDDNGKYGRIVCIASSLYEPTPDDNNMSMDRHIYGIILDSGSEWGELFTDGVNQYHWKMRECDFIIIEEQLCFDFMK